MQSEVRLKVQPKKIPNELQFLVFENFQQRMHRMISRKNEIAGKQ